MGNLRQGAMATGMVVLLGLNGAPPGMAQQDERIEEAHLIFNRGKHLHQEGRLDEAIAEYRRSIALDDQNPWVFNSLGLALSAKREFKEALKAFERALTVNPDLTDVHNNLGVIYAETGKREKAYEEFMKVIRDPSYPTPEKAHFNLGNLYFREKNFELALMHFRRAVEKKPRFALGYRGLGLVYGAMDQPREAMEQFEKAVAVDSKDLPSLYELARLHEQQGRTDKALELYRRVVEQDRSSTLGKLSLGRLEALQPGR